MYGTIGVPVLKIPSVKASGGGGIVLKNRFHDWVFFICTFPFTRFNTQVPARVQAWRPPERVEQCELRKAGKL